MITKTNILNNIKLQGTRMKNNIKKALRIFKACKEQTENFYRLFNEEEREILRELLEDY